jgi:hypothetical protein
MGPTKYCTMILMPKTSENVPHISLLEPGIPDCRLSWVFSKHKLFLIWGTARWTTDQPISRMPFQLSDVQVLWSWHQHLCIWSILSVLRSLAIAALPLICVGLVKLTSHSFCGKSVFRMNTYSVLLPCQLCCSNSVIFLKHSFSVYDYLFLSVLIFAHCSSSLMLSSHDSCMPFSRFVYADIILKAVAVIAPNNEAVFVTDSPAKRAPKICSL